MIRVLFVCLGNICRSPTAHGVFLHQLQQAGMDQLVEVDSCGTGGWHVGAAPDKRATAAAKKRGVDLSVLRARQLQDQDYHQFNYILAMDRDNLAEIQQRRPTSSQAQVGLFLDYATHVSEMEVPDPYYGGESGFEKVLDMIENASAGLLQELCRALSRR